MVTVNTIKKYLTPKRVISSIVTAAVIVGASTYIYYRSDKGETPTIEQSYYDPVSIPDGDRLYSESKATLGQISDDILNSEAFSCSEVYVDTNGTTQDISYPIIATCNYDCTSSICLQNDSENEYDMWITIYDYDTGDVYFESGKIEPGYMLEDIKFSTVYESKSADDVYRTVCYSFTFMKDDSEELSRTDSYGKILFPQNIGTESIENEDTSTGDM